MAETNRYLLKPRRSRLRTLAALGLVGVLAFLGWRCGRGVADRVLVDAEDDPVSAEADRVDLAGAPDFIFVMGEGSGLQGYDVVKVRADGTCEYTFAEWSRRADPVHGLVNAQTWKRATFSTDPQTVSDLRALLADVDYFHLKKAYHARGVHDGTQWVVKVQASGRRKEVYCNNHFPRDVRRVSEFVHARVLDPNRGATGQAPVVELKLEDYEPGY